MFFGGFIIAVLLSVRKRLDITLLAIHAGRSINNDDSDYCLCRVNSGAGTTFQQGGQDQPFPAGGLGAL